MQTSGQLSDPKPHLGRPRDDALVARRRDEILRAAVRHFSRDGYFDADLDAIAADIGCAKGTLYRYFENKADLFQQSVDLVMQDLIARTSASPSTDPLEQLRHAIRSYLAYFEAHPEYVELLIQERAAFRARKKPTYFVHRDSVVDRWTPRYEAMIAQGRMRPMPIDRIHDVIGDLLYGTIFTNYFAGRRKTLDQQIADVLDVLFHGLLTPDEVARQHDRANQPGDAQSTGDNPT